MSLESKIIALATAVGVDVKALYTKNTEQGTLASLTTTDKANLVAAISEIHDEMTAHNAGAVAIADGSTTSTTNTWSVAKIEAVVNAAKVAVTDSILDGAGAALDTLNELAEALGDDANFATSMATALGNRVRFDVAQALDATQMAQAYENLDLGDPDANFVTSYAAAKA